MHHRVPFRPPPVAAGMRDYLGGFDLLSVTGQFLQDGEPVPTRDWK